jgi:hypothetical protein
MHHSQCITGLYKHARQQHSQQEAGRTVSHRHVLQPLASVQGGAFLYKATACMCCEAVGLVVLERPCRMASQGAQAGAQGAVDC